MKLNRINYIHFNYSGFSDYDNFVIKLLENLNRSTQYSLLLKVNYNEYMYAMAGKQIGFMYICERDKKPFKDLHESMIFRLEQLYCDYEVDEINSIQLLTVKISDIPELKLKNVNNILFNKEFTKVKYSKNRFNLIPLTIDTNYFGNIVLSDKLFYLKRLNKQRSLINQNELCINDIGSMYIYKDNLLIVNNKTNNSIIYRYIYNINSGILIYEIKDKIISDSSFIRTIGNNNLYISSGRILKLESEKKLSPIQYKFKSLKDEANPFIGSLDLEAYYQDGYAKVYAIGFVGLHKNVKTYYLDNGITSEQLVLNCINDMLTNEYNGYTFYTHNLGRYDSIFLLKILIEENNKKGVNFYKLNTFSKDNKVLKLIIKSKRKLSDRSQSKIGARKDPGYNTITIVDSINLLNQSLDDLCKSFNVEVFKGKFPHSFVKPSTLNYIGNTPDYKYWTDISLYDYNKLVKSDWCLKDECIKYLERDLISLTSIMHKFSVYVNRKYTLQVTDSLTISRLALNIFLKEYLNESKLPIIRKNMFVDIKQAYYGGVTEVYKPYGENLYHYDVNSLYPFSSLNPIPGINCSYIENMNSHINLHNIFGFFYCSVETTDNYLGLLPVHTKQGLIMPNGKWKGWYFSEELKFAHNNGYKINIIKGYNFNKEYNVFTNFVNDLYKIKSTTKYKVDRNINKSLLNNLLGRFGMNIFKPNTKLVDSEKMSFILSTRSVIGEPKKITENAYWLTYHTKVDSKLCEQHNIDYIKVCNLKSKADVEKLDEFKDVSISTTASVTAYARIYMSKIKLHILNKGGNIYYTDTDSIISDIPLDDIFIGNELGKFKLEHKIKQAYFISNKTYCLVPFESKSDVNCIIRAKGLISASLNINDFKNLYKGISVKAVRKSTTINHNKGFVFIKHDKIKLNHNSYTKRSKIYKKGYWIDTKPLIIKDNKE